MIADQHIDVGVIGVGAMGRNHARVYAGLPRANLVGVFDIDDAQAEAVANRYDTSVVTLEELLERVDAASVAVPTAHHYKLATRCLNAGVAPLVEKPIVEDVSQGRELQAKADAVDVPVQVGHVERFNPAVLTLKEILDNFSVLSLRAQRLGPSPDRRIEDSAALDLMIHDVDVVLALLGEVPTTIESCGVADGRHASALLEFDSGQMASLTASRVTQRKVRTLEITAEEGLIELDYIDQSIAIHRQSVPEYVADDGDICFRHENIVERPRVSSGEPLRKQLASFLDVVASNGTPRVSIEDGLAALEITRRIEKRERLEAPTVRGEMAYE